MTMMTATNARPRLASKEAGSGPILILIHGGMGSRNHWARNIDALATKFRVIAIDLPGYGESPDVDRDLSADDYNDLVCRGIDTLIGKDATFRLVGFSFGSAVCSHVAARAKSRVKGMSLLGVSGFGRPEGRDLKTRSYRSAKGDEKLFLEIARENLLAFMLKDPASADDVAVAYHAENVKRTRFDSRIVSWGDSQRKDLPLIKCPLQLIWGEHDITAHPSIDARVAICREFIPDLRLDIISDSAHWAMYDSAETVNQALMEFHCHVTE
jgi:2-hydroxy-6-oxonona-2,4-dienedioate hydrolase